MSLTVTCPNGHRIKAKEKYAGKRVRCPRCQSTIQIPRFVTGGEGMTLIELEVTPAPYLMPPGEESLAPPKPTAAPARAPVSAPVVQPSNPSPDFPLTQNALQPAPAELNSFLSPVKPDQLLTPNAGLGESQTPSMMEFGPPATTDYATGSPPTSSRTRLKPIHIWAALGCGVLAGSAVVLAVAMGLVLLGTAPP